MTTCKRCGKEKPDQEFPWLLQRVCHDCHMWCAMHWNEIPWPESKASEAKRKAASKAGKASAKRQGVDVQNNVDSTQSEKTDSDTFQLELVN